MKKTFLHKTFSTVTAIAVISIAGFTGCAKKENKYVKVGLLHSLSGSMAISECAVRDAELLAIEEINNAGGVLGKQIKVIQEDGASDPLIFVEKTEKLLKEDNVATVFGCWTSASRKAVKPIFEEQFGLLWYPVQYEGVEASPNIMYMGAAPNQQVVPAISYCAEHYGKKMFLIGSDYIFPQTANKIIKAQLKDMGGTCVGEHYVAMTETNFVNIIEEIKKTEPNVIVNTLNGDANVFFFKQLKDAGITADKIPVMSFSVAEGEISHIGPEYAKGHLVSWNYFETTDTQENQNFIKAYKAQFGQNRRLGDPIEAGYIAVHLWAQACEKAQSFDVEAVRIAAKGMTYVAPEGLVTIDGFNQHLYKPVRIGKIGDNGDITEIWATPEPIRPDPYLSTYAWARGL
ncbi:urea ABC transporter substrate-binding protein [Treponema sp.]|uniref:urea ABC transporter substrate-binding protein n=1 Tax=Treponema sp. TaxID=166 RepID=UPI00298EAEE2|nr:urea ABC transporter substrate-binding protein [Treponema sp.]MCR5613547.1 urea ABC transporter substrate-binding protein [Treponema sp.]